MGSPAVKSKNTGNFDRRSAVTDRNTHCKADGQRHDHHKQKPSFHFSPPLNFDFIFFFSP
jgi:hypothetical protein